MYVITCRCSIDQILDATSPKSRTFVDGSTFIRTSSSSYLLSLSLSHSQRKYETVRQIPINSQQASGRERDGWSFSFDGKRRKEEAKNLKDEILSVVLAKRMRTSACTHTDTCALIWFLNLSARIERGKTTLRLKRPPHLPLSLWIHVYLYLTLSTIWRNCSAAWS